MDKFIGLTVVLILIFGSLSANRPERPNLYDQTMGMDRGGPGDYNYSPRQRYYQQNNYYYYQPQPNYPYYNWYYPDYQYNNQYFDQSK